MKPYKLNYAIFQSSVSAPGIFPSDMTLNDEKYPGLIMTYPHPETPGCVMVEYKNRKVLVPIMNIKSMVVEKECQPEDPKKK